MKYKQKVKKLFTEAKKPSPEERRDGGKISEKRS